MDDLFSPDQLKGIDLEGFNISELRKFFKPGGIQNFSALFPKPPEASKEEIAAKITFYVVSFIFAFFGNWIIVVLILATKGLRTLFNIYILNLATADIMVASFCMWIHLVTDLSPVYPFGMNVCRVSTFFQVLSVTVSVLSLTTVVLNRFISARSTSPFIICQIRYKLTIFLIWFMSVLLSLPWLLYTKLVEFDWAGGHERSCQEIFPSKLARKVYMTLFATLVYILPLVTMILLTAMTMVSTQQQQLSSRPTSEIVIRMRIRAQQMVLTVLLTFIVCWTPQQATLLWDVYRDPDKPKPPNIGAIKYTAIYLAYTNSAINPVIYIVFNDCFRDVLKKFLRCQMRPGGNVSVSPASDRVVSVISVSSS